MGMRDRKIFRDAMPADGSAQLQDVTNAFTTFAAVGSAREGHPRCGDGSANMAGGVPVPDLEDRGYRRRANAGLRISYVGELGWEIYVPIEQGLRVWDAIWRAGHPHGLVPVGIGTYAVTSRLEKGYRAHGAELELEFDLVEAGMARVKDQDRGLPESARHGRDPVHADGQRPHVEERREALHARPRADPRRGRQPAGQREGPAVKTFTSAGSGPWLGEHLLDVLPAAGAGCRRHQAPRRVLRGRYPVTVAVAGATPLFDPDNERIRADGGVRILVAIVERVPAAGVARR